VSAPVLADHPLPPPIEDAAPPRTTIIRRQTAARIVLAAVLFGIGLWTVQEFIPAIVWAVVLAIALWPLYRRARRRWPGREHDPWLPAAFTCAIALLFFLPLVVVGVQAGREAHSVVEWVEKARTQGVPPPELLSRLPVGRAQATAWWQQNLKDPEGARDLLDRANRGEVVSSSRRIGAAVLHRTMLFGFCLLTLFFLFRDGERLAEQMRRASRRAFGPSGERVGRQIIASVHGTVDGLVLVGIGEGVVMGIAYALAGVPHPTLLGGATAIAAMIPFGAPVAFGLAALLAAAAGSVTAAIAIVVAGLVVTFVADHFIRPVLIGGQTRLPFVWVLFGILGGVKVWGLIGLFVGPAVMAALILLWREWTEGPHAPAPEA